MLFDGVREGRLASRGMLCCSSPINVIRDSLLENLVESTGCWECQLSEPALLHIQSYVFSDVQVSLRFCVSAGVVLCYANVLLRCPIMSHALPKQLHSINEESLL